MRDGANKYAACSAKVFNKSQRVNPHPTACDRFIVVTSYHADGLTCEIHAIMCLLPAHRLEKYRTVTEALLYSAMLRTHK